MNSASQWGQISDKFDTYKKEVWEGAADNIDAVWPVILDYIKKHFTSAASQKALEFGCGTGMFCQELQKFGFNVTGIDYSEEMITIAKKNLDPSIKLLTGDSQTAKNLGQFNLVTAIMVLQFMEDKNIMELASCVAKNGHIIFATHNPSQLESSGRDKIFTIGGTGLSVPIFKRTPKDYDKLFMALGFSKTWENFAQSSKEFQKKYNITRDEDIPKYMILGYKKN